MRPGYSFFFAAEDRILGRATGVAQQAYLRTQPPPASALWGRSDPHFVPPGAEVFKRNGPFAELCFADSGYFASEAHALEVGAAMREPFCNHIG